MLPTAASCPRRHGTSRGCASHGGVKSAYPELFGQRDNVPILRRTSEPSNWRGLDTRLAPRRARAARGVEREEGVAAKAVEET